MLTRRKREVSGKEGRVIRSKARKNRDASSEKGFPAEGRGGSEKKTKLGKHEGRGE